MTPFMSNVGVETVKGHRGCVCVLSPQLLEVISELKQQGLNILVLGRKHMLRPSWNWDRQNMNKIKQKAHCFFTENMLVSYFFSTHAHTSQT